MSVTVQRITEGKNVSCIGLNNYDRIEFLYGHYRKLIWKAVLVYLLGARSENNCFKPPCF